MMNIATISTADLKAAQWTSVSVERSLKDAASKFQFEAVEGGAISAGAILSLNKIMPTDPCTILLGNVPIIVGYIETRNPSYDDQNSGVSFSGRAKTGDLIDSSAVIPGGEFVQADLEQIAGRLTSDYGIGLKVIGDIGAPFPAESITPGESPWEFIERLARSRGFAVHDDEEGNLVLEQYQPRQSVASLIEGHNIKAASAVISAADQFSETIVKGQKRSSDDAHGKDSSEIIAKAGAASMPRYRPKLVLTEGPSDLDDARMRADWETAQSGADSLTIDITVQGWFGMHGLWKPGDVYFISSPKIPIARDMLCESCSWTQDESAGTLTKMKLIPPETYTPSAGGDGGGGASSSSDKTWSSAKPAEGAL